jgi:signal transduction histidine kinase
MTDLELGDLYEAAALATINERFAPAYLHDVRGTMQALFSAMELLLRSAQTGADRARVEKACDLAKRAIANHEKSTMDVFRLLTLERDDTVNVDLNRMIQEVAHILRNDAAVRGVKISVTTTTDLVVAAEKGKLHTLLLGLLAAGIDSLPAGSELQVSTTRRAGEAIVAIDAGAAYADFMCTNERSQRSPTALRAHELTFLFAERFLTGNGGCLTLDHANAERPTLSLHYPSVSLAQVRESATEK